MANKRRKAEICNFTMCLEKKVHDMGRLLAKHRGVSFTRFVENLIVLEARRYHDWMKKKEARELKENPPKKKKIPLMKYEKK